MRFSLLVLGSLISSSILAQSTTSQDYIRNQPAVVKTPKTFSITAYAEGLYTLSDMWSNTMKGPGILQGFGGGVQYTYYMKPRVGLTGQIGFSQWGVLRRYVAEGTDRFTNDQTVSRLAVQIGARFYANRVVYFQPMIGGQQLTLTSRNSATHPNGVNEVVTKKFLPSISGTVGFEIPIKSLIADVGAQYYFLPNSDFAGITQSLQFAGLRLGIGYRSK